MKQLSKDEMKKLMGGYLAPIMCNVRYDPGYSGAYYLCQNATQAQCQTAASSWCESNAGCNSVKC